MSGLHKQDINISLGQNLKGFQGSPDAVSKEVWKKEVEKCHDFGTCTNCHPLSYDDEEEIRAYVTSDKFKSEKDLHGLLCYILGSYFFLHGLKEHKKLKWSMTIFGKHGHKIP